MRKDRNMTDMTTNTPMTMEQVERRARELRSEAARDLVLAIGRGLRRLWSATFGARGIAQA